MSCRHVRACGNRLRPHGTPLRAANVLRALREQWSSVCPKPFSGFRWPIDFGVHHRVPLANCRFSLRSCLPMRVRTSTKPHRPMHTPALGACSKPIRISRLTVISLWFESYLGRFGSLSMRKRDAFDDVHCLGKPHADCLQSVEHRLLRIECRYRCSKTAGFLQEVDLG